MKISKTEILLVKELAHSPEISVAAASYPHTESTYFEQTRARAHLCKKKKNVKCLGT